MWGGVVADPELDTWHLMIIGGTILKERAKRGGAERTNGALWDGSEKGYGSTVELQSGENVVTVNTGDFSSDPPTQNPPISLSPSLKWQRLWAATDKNTAC